MAEFEPGDKVRINKNLFPMFKRPIKKGTEGTFHVKCTYFTDFAIVLIDGERRTIMTKYLEAV